MGDVQAIPDNLFSYSDQTSGANSDIAQWVSSVLASAMRLYQETAIDLGSDIAELTHPGTSGIDVETLSALSAISVTDEQVRVIGQAFLDAGDQGQGSITHTVSPEMLRQLGHDPRQYAVITTTDSVLDQDVRLEDQRALQHAEADGKLLADYAANNGFDDYFWKQLQEHENDPLYCAVLLNELAADGMLATFMDSAYHKPGSDQEKWIIAALINGYASRQLSRSAGQEIVATLLGSNGQDSPQSSPSFVIGFLTENEFLRAEGLYAEFKVAQSLLSGGDLVIWENGREVPVTPAFTGCASEDQLVNWVCEHNGHEGSSPPMVVLAGTNGNTTLDSLMNAAGSEYFQYITNQS